MADYLKPYKKKKVKSVVPLARPFRRPKKVQAPYDTGGDQDTDKKHYLTVNWKLPDTSDAALAFSFRILGHILIGTPASLLKMRCSIRTSAKTWQGWVWKQICAISFFQPVSRVRAPGTPKRSKG